IGWIYFKMNRYEEAVDFIRQSLSIDPENNTIKDHLDEVVKAKSKETTPKIHQVEKQD
ncbi:MAG: tetratricopeptide repeat protein, partial [Candidatus Marinimicrobia bacterium]|nr:tetratricopeptide repeat protein [Candidatus Neomarinimicrobiota bacterium]